MNKTKKSWQEYWLMFQYYKFPAIATFLLTIILAITAALKVERTYIVNSKIKLESVNKEIIDSLTSPEAISTNNPSDIEQKNSQSLVDLEQKSTTLSKQVFEKLKTENNYLATVDYEQFVKQLDINNNSQTDTIEITYSGKDINSSRLVVNSLIESYQNQQAQTELSNVSKIKDKFNQQLAFLIKIRKKLPVK